MNASVATGASMFALRNVSGFRISGSRGVKDMEIDNVAARTL
jgi:hypothetical protein